MSEFTEEHGSGVRAFTDQLEHATATCEECGFEDHVLHGEWRAQVGTSKKSGHLRYLLSCPDCGETRTIELNVDV